MTINDVIRSFIEAHEEIVQWFQAIPNDKKNQIILLLLACLWLIRRVNAADKKKRERQAPKPYFRELSQKDLRKILEQRKFREDGSYWSPEENKWIAPDYENIPRDYHWDPIGCRWLPPNHPDHPRFHMNDRDEEYYKK